MNRRKQDPHRIRRFAAVAGLAAAAFAGCGAGESSEDSATSQRQQAEEAALEHARCLRERGVDVPDPKPGEGGLILQAPGGPQEPEKMREAAKACEKYLAKGAPLALSDEQKSEMQDGALAHARCMRQQGVDFPDPTFDENGAARIELGEGFDPGDPEIRRAEAACAKYRPGPIAGAAEVSP